jgi:hypothetical protein
LALVAALAAFLGRNLAAGRLATRVRPGIVWLPLNLARWASAVLDLVLRPHGAKRQIAQWWYLLWALAALLPMGLFFANYFWPPPLPFALDAGWLLVVGLLFQVLVIAAGYVIAHDDFDYMDGVIEGEPPRIRGNRTATRSGAIALTVALFIAYAAAIAFWLSAVEGLPVVDLRPVTSVHVVDYLLVALRALPTDYLLSLLDWLTGDSTAVVFSNSFPGQLYYFAIRGFGVLIAIGVIAIAIQKTWQLRRIVMAIAASSEHPVVLIRRAAQSPPAIRNGILRAALTPSTVERQKRLIVAAKEMGIFILPQTFCRSVETFDPEIQVYGLEQCLEMFRRRARDFDPEQINATFVNAAAAFERGKLGLEPTKTSLRLMTSLLVHKRGLVHVDNALHALLAAAIAKEFDKPRGKEDPALRGFLRDFQSALNGPGQPLVNRPANQPERKQETLKRLPEPAGQVAPPDTRAPTVH